MPRNKKIKQRNLTHGQIRKPQDKVQGFGDTTEKHLEKSQYIIDDDAKQ